jgi:acyl-CoA reductase-like NAD-dependent aldehyde dehydrogenase
MRERVAAYGRLSATLRERSETLAALITAEMGKTIAAARAEVEKCAATIDWIAENGPAILADEPVTVDGDDQVHVFVSADRHRAGDHAVEFSAVASDARIRAGHVVR